MRKTPLNQFPSYFLSTLTVVYLFFLLQVGGVPEDGTVRSQAPILRQAISATTRGSLKC